MELSNDHWRRQDIQAGRLERAIDLLEGDVDYHTMSALDAARRAVARLTVAGWCK
jgi:hypothetical protein